jgi:glycosyltransferase involved in cell wall biosynthesis
MSPSHSCDVSVVIPSVGRASCRAAVLSALTQSCAPREVIVVVDGTHDEALRLRSELPGGVTVLDTGGPSNANVARNLGIAAASGHLVALLDDDDTWAQDKLAEQLKTLPSCTQDWLSACRARMVGADDKSLVVPDRPPHPGENMGDYLFRRTNPLKNRHILQTSTWLGPRRLFVKMPFDESLHRHQDWDWLLHASLATALDVRVSRGVLVQYNRGTPNSMSARVRWHDSLEWVRGVTAILSARAAGDFVASVVHGLALSNGDVAGSVRVLRLGRRVGKPGLPALMAAAMRYGPYAARALRRPRHAR